MRDETFLPLRMLRPNEQELVDSGQVGFVNRELTGLTKSCKPDMLLSRANEDRMSKVKEANS